MAINTNSWNRIRYTFHSVYYDFILLLLQKERAKALSNVKINGENKILIVGAGTGLDLPYLDTSWEITAIDITPAMLSKLERRAKQMNMLVDAYVMDGQQLEFEDNSFDYVILNLILAVIPDPVRCIKEAERVLKADGSIIIFDKFLKDGQKMNVARKGVNFVTSLLFSNINRRFSEIMAETNLKVVMEQASVFNGMFMIYRLEKNN